MFHQSKNIFLKLQQLMQGTSLAIILIVGISLSLASILAAVGTLPWLTLQLQFGQFVFPNAGMTVQLGVTFLMLTLCFFIPASIRMLQLERSHRSFTISMDDVTRAYATSHQADRDGVFTISSEYDAVRERLKYMRDHPDLATLEPDVLEVAAQMSQQSTQLAAIYSDERITRARSFLRQRQSEIEDMQNRIGMAKRTCSDLRRWAQQIDIEENLVQQQMDRLEEDLFELLPDLGYNFELDGSNVVAIPAKATEIAKATKS